jgi:sarcosine oxidase subunit gamma
MKFVAGHGVSIKEKDIGAMLNLRGNPEDESFRLGVRRALDIDLPVRPMTSSRTVELSCFWLAPDAWLIVTAYEMTNDIKAKLKNELQHQHVAVVDVSDLRVALRLSGAQARELLMKVGASNFNVLTSLSGKIMQASFTNVPAIVYAQSDSPLEFDVLIPRSYAEFIWQWLADAANKMSISSGSPA